jgi:signal transduction histidine kinase
LLALIDVMVIIATLYANHRTIKSFDAALADVVASHDRQSWLNDLRFAIIQLNAPGNDIFQSHDLPGERTRFAEAEDNYKKLLSQGQRNLRLTEGTTAHVAQMTRAAEDIFARFEGILDDTVPESRKASLLSAATETMAEMDRAQADALAGLADESRSALTLQRTVLDGHQAALAQRTGIERIFMGVVLFILVGVFLYGRQLQRTHERLEHERNRAESERQSRLASIGEVCFACAHGIRNPLTAIITSAQLVMNHGTLDDQSRDRLQNLIDSAWFLNDCVTRLLTFAHAPKLTVARLAPEDVLERALATLNDRIHERGIRVTRSYGSGELAINADETLLTQAAIELINNAIDHAPEGGRISLVTTSHRDNGGWVELGVVDDGPGIPAAVRGRACELFFTMRTGGTGIGLATVKRAAELHEGIVLLGEAKPCGADVRIRLPGVSVA